MFTLTPNLSNYFDIESKLISLGHLAGQLGGFVGESESVKKAVVNAIIAKINSNEELKHLYSSLVTNLSESVKPADQADDTDEISELSKLVTAEIQRLEQQLKQPNKHPNNLPSCPSPSADSDKLQSKLEALKKVNELCGFLTNLNNHPNEPKKLLENLCTGLEKFLGFNSDSKGYDGTGIVYSDLDRLCDGVMAFLYQVLKDVSEKQPYSVGKTILNDIVNELKKNLSTGRKGFEVIAQVAQRVRGYNERVKEGNERVKTVIGKLFDKINETGMWRKSINAMQASDNLNQAEEDVKSAAFMVKECLETTEVFTNALDIVHPDNRDMKNSINDLNTNLRDNVLNARMTIEHESERLAALSAKAWNDLAGMTNKTRDALNELKTNVTNEISDKVLKLVVLLNQKVLAIRNQLIEIERDLGHYIHQLENWMDKAKKLIDDVTNTHINAIINHGVGYVNHKKLEDIADEIRRGLNAARNHLNDMVTKALEQVKAMDAALKGDLYKVKQAIGEQVKKIQQEIRSLGNQFNGGSGTTPDSIEKIMKHIKEKIDDIEGHVGESRKPGSASGADASVQQNWDALKAKMTELLGDIYERSSAAKMNYLGKIEKGVTEYAALFKDTTGGNGFNKRVDEWVAEIITKEPVKGLLTEYVKQNRSIGFFNGYMSDKGPDRLRNHVTPILKLQITEKLQEIKPKITFGTKPNVEGYLSYVTDYLSEFSKNAMSKEDGIVTAISSVVQLDVQLVASADHRGHRKFYLELAVRATLSALTFIAKHIAYQLESFASTNTDLGTKLPAAIKQVKLISQQFDPGNSFGAKIDRALSSVQLEVKTLHRQLNSALEPGVSSASNAKFVDTAISDMNNVANDHIGTTPLPGGGTSNERISELGRNGFEKYKQQVNQDSLIQGNPEKFSGVLPAAIGEIRDHGFKVFEKMLTGTKPDEQHSIGHLEQMKSNLTNLIAAFSAAGKAIEANLGNLKEGNITNDLKIIRNQIDTLRTVDLGRIIKDATKFHSFATTQCEETVQTLTRHVDNEVESALSTLTTAARRNYVTSVKALLTAFADKVEKELEGLPGEIDKDLTIGYKGFMKTLGDGYTKGTITSNNINLLKSLATLFKSNEYNARDFSDLAEAFYDFFTPVKKYVLREISSVHGKENEKRNRNPSSKETLYTNKFNDICAALESLLTHIKDKNKYDSEVPKMLVKLTSKITELKPENFDMQNTPTMDSVSLGLNDFVSELEKVYISAYDGQKYEKDVYIYKQRVDTRGKVEIHEVTEYGMNCAKVFLTALSTLSYDFQTLGEKCKGSQFQTIYASNENITNVLGDYLISRGYKVSMSRESHEGQLRNEPKCAGQAIYLSKLNEQIKTAVNLKQVEAWKEEQKKENKFTHPRDADSNKINLLDILDYLQYCLETYYQVRHYATFFSKKQPCSVYEMLCWLSGMPCNNAYEELLGDGLSDPFKDPRKQTKEVAGESEFTVETPESLYLDASPKTMKYANTVRVVRHLCPISHDLLTILLGHGDAETTYAVDFSSNAMNLHYPQKGEDCLQMLLDILCRLLPQLRYLHEKCKLGTEHGGWYSCKYGKVIKTSKWPCSDHSSDEAKDKATCQPKSPLQSYLNDCLPGHLPHRVESIGCNAVCKTCPGSKPGMPCLTPLGFRGFSGSTKRGKDICTVLTKFFDEVDISCLFALSVKPPRTLPEHFGFTLSLVNGWHTSNKSGFRNVLQDTFDNAIYNLSIQLADKQGTLPDALRKAYGSDQESHSRHETDSADLVSLSLRMPCTGADNHCAPYVSTSCVDIYNYLPYKHANLYLSWAIYLPWTFWDLLNNLYNSFCSINCQDWGCRGCLRGDKCKKGSHGVVDKEKPSADCQCPSIVDCKGVAPTLYQYGFVFGEASTLNDSQSPKKCSDFCSQLKNVLKSQYFKKLFEECDNFLWIIRQPFTYLVLALWLLSLLYLLHIMVIRLDLLHIKSHLHSPSTHRIAAQSLLAAARVNKLNRVFYLQP
ncbi:hypothetical protein, conserved [Babesia bigemina]|uniref:C3H1-type domain-containing protein n=1 Tax=Babesia bigemina TaxID=5866 RepID=A0A061BK63_BABBI|nr:hypothetical protein, conserved [Babesia bigemina]CDR71870.1 hypothetical protein, conserved [Babesia bigemina]|eukprot:XP_012770813.1 hypothetical protein, conserved [Babesia bigemina]